MADEASLYPEEMDTPEPEPKEDGGDDAKQALLPKSIFGDKEVKPGDTCSFKVVQTMDDEVLVEYQSSEDKESPKEEMSPDEEIDSMAQPLTA